VLDAEEASRELPRRERSGRSVTTAGVPQAESYLRLERC
jgi:hypothetical protein